MKKWQGPGLVALGLMLALGSGFARGQSIDLPTSKQIVRPVPGSPQRLNSLPMSMAVSPDARYVVTVNAGYGTFESNYMQSLAVLDTQTGKVADFPEADTLGRAKQTLYSGLAFSRDGKRLYASMGSEADPLGTMSGDTGSGVVVYGFSDGKIVRQTDDEDSAAAVGRRAEDDADRRQRGR